MASLAPSLEPAALTPPGRLKSCLHSLFRAEHGLALGSLLACLIGLLALEGLMRVADPGYLGRLSATSLDELHRYSEVYGWELRPGARLQDHGLWTSVNAAGYRGPELPRQHVAGHTRVVLLGDSITFGTYVGDGQTFADLLNGGEGRLEVVNLAVQGYGLEQSLLRLEREGLSYAPDLVVLNVCLANDFVDGMLPVFLYDGRHPKPYYRLEGERLVLHDEHVRLSAAGRLGLALRERSQLFNRLLALAKNDTGEAAAEPWAERRGQALRNRAAALELGLRLIARMRERAEGHGARFVVALHPDRSTYKHGSEWLEGLRSAPELAGLPVIDLASEYHARGLRFGELTLDDIGHLSPLGHRQAAAILERALCSRVPVSVAAGRQRQPQAAPGPREADQRLVAPVEQVVHAGAQLEPGVQS